MRRKIRIRIIIRITNKNRNKNKKAKEPSMAPVSYRSAKTQVCAGALLICGWTMLFLASNARAQAVTGLAPVRMASALPQPLFVTAPPGDYNRVFIVRQTGQVQVLNLATGAMNATPFLDIHTRLTATNGEQGLLGMAFDPNYATN